MFYVGCFLFGLGMLFYAGSIALVGSTTAEILSDSGNGVMLTAAVLLLLRRERRAQSAPADAGDAA